MCIVYIITGYITFVIPRSLWICFTHYRPALHPGVDLELNNRPFPRFDEQLLALSADNAAETRDILWQRWLASYSCFPVKYLPKVKREGTPAEQDASISPEACEIKTDEEEKSEGKEQLKKTEENSVPEWVVNCPICLQELEEGVELVNYPCSTRIHFFHTSCMYDWLTVASRRGLEGISCPCCREAPVMIFPPPASSVAPTIEPQDIERPPLTPGSDEHRHVEVASDERV